MIMGYEMTKTIKMLLHNKNHGDFWHLYHYWVCQDGVGTCTYCPYYVDENALMHWDCAGYAELVEVLR